MDFGSDLHIKIVPRSGSQRPLIEVVAGASDDGAAGGDGGADFGPAAAVRNRQRPLIEMLDDPPDKLNGAHAEAEADQEDAGTLVMPSTAALRPGQMPLIEVLSDTPSANADTSEEEKAKATEKATEKAAEKTTEKAAEKENGQDDDEVDAGGGTTVGAVADEVANASAEDKAVAAAMEYANYLDGQREHGWKD